MKEFIAYYRKLLKALDGMERASGDGDAEKAREMVSVLMEDTQKDIEA